MKIFLPPDFVDWLQNYDCFICRNCGQGVSVPKGEIPKFCKKCEGTTLENVDDEREPA